MLDDSSFCSSQIDCHLLYLDAFLVFRHIKTLLELQILHTQNIKGMFMSWQKKIGIYPDDVSTGHNIIKRA